HDNVSGSSKKYLYSNSSWRFAVATMLVGFKTRSAEQIERETERVITDSTKKELYSILDLAARKMPGWQGIRRGAVGIKEFKYNNVLGSSPGLTAFSYAIHAVREA